MLARLTFIAALAFAPVATAQDAAPPATAEQVAAARAEADRIIATAQAGDLVVNITGNAHPMVRHKASGLICIFNDAPEVNRISIYPGPRGDDVSCSTKDEPTGAETTVYATRYDPMPTEQEALTYSVRAVKQRFPSARLYEGDLILATTDTVTPIGSAMVIDTNHGTMFTLVIVEHQGPWAYKLRATGPIDQATAINTSAGLGFTTMLMMKVLPPFSGE